MYFYSGSGSGVCDYCAGETGALPGTLSCVIGWETDFVVGEPAGTSGTSVGSFAVH